TVSKRSDDSEVGNKLYNEVIKEYMIESNSTNDDIHLNFGINTIRTSNLKMLHKCDSIYIINKNRDKKNV
ncbi:MAG: hypothetical protein MJ252_15145, partial [archaeon]|nr:hypothetical protein [archaeon]